MAPDVPDVPRTSPNVAGRRRTPPDVARRRPTSPGVPGSSPCAPGRSRMSSGRRRDVAGTSPSARGRPRDVPAGTFIFSAPESMTNNRFVINAVVSFAIFWRFVHSPHAV